MADGDESIDRSRVPHSAGEDDDHDLLTVEEAGVRLQDELEAAKAELDRRTEDPDRSRDHVSAAEARLAQLRDAVARNGRDRPDAERGFLDYRRERTDPGS